MKIYQLLEAVKLNEAQSVYAKSLPDVYKKLPYLGKGMTSIVLDKGDGNVLMFTRDSIKHEWLTRDWGIKIGKTVDVLHNMPHKKMEIRDMDVFVVEMPKLHKLDAKNKSILRKELNNWNELTRPRIHQVDNRTRSVRFIDNANEFIGKYPDSILNPILEFMMNYDKVSFDVAIRNTLQDEKGNIIFVDPLVSDELLGYLRTTT